MKFDYEVYFVSDLPPLIPDAENASENNIDGDMIVDEEVDSSPESESDVIQSRLSRKNKVSKR